MPKKQGLYTCSLTLLLAAGSAYAEQGKDNFELSPEQLFDATVMSVSKTSEKLKDAPAAIYVLSGEDIARSGATSIPEALRLVPGVQVARASANSWAVNIRGFNGALADKLLVLIDGRAVYDPLFAGVYWDVQDTVLEDIDRIEVIRGPGATLWGANAVDGVINIITKKAADTQGNLASASAGNQLRGMTEGRHGGKLGDDGYYRIYAKHQQTDAEDFVNGADARDGQVMDRSGFRTDWKGSSDTRDDFTFQGDMYHSHASEYRIIPHFNTAVTTTELEKLLAQGGNMLGRWNRTLSSDSRFTLQSYVDYFSRDQLLLKDQHTTFDVDAQYEMEQNGRHKVIIGGGFRYGYDDLTPSPLVYFTHRGEQTQLFSSFVQDKITLVPKDWFLTLGTKLEHNDYTGIEIEPNARLQWNIDDKQMAWSSIARAVRTPNRLEEDLELVQAAAAGVSLDTVPNSHLNSEELIAYELGYRRQWTPDISTDVATFYNQYTDLSTFVSGGLLAGVNPPRVVIALMPVNGTRAETYGGEVSANWRAQPDLNLSASYSLLKMELHNINPSNEAAEFQSPSHQVNARAQWDVTKDVTFDTMAYYTSSLASFNVQDHVRLDMRVGWRITDGLQFSLVGQDLLDDSHHEFGSLTDPHVFATEINRSIYGNVTWHF